MPTSAADGAPIQQKYGIRVRIKVFFARQEGCAVSSSTRVAWGGVSFPILSIYLCPTYLYKLFIERKRRYTELFNGLSFEFEVV